MQPYNFSIGGNLPDPSQAFTSGLQSGNAVLQLDRQQQQQALELQAQQQALRAQEQYTAAVQGVLSKPSAEGYARLMTLRPKEAEGMTKAWAALSAEKQQAGLSDLTQWTAAVENGRPDLAITAMNARADMIDRDAGGKSAEGEALRAQAKILEADPTTGARLVLAPMLYAHPDGKRALDNITIQAGEARAAAKAPAELRTANAGASKAEADAKTAGVTAENAPAMAQAGLTKAQTEAAFADELARLSVQRSRAEVSNINSQIQERGKRLALDEKRLNNEIAEKLGLLPTTKLDAASKKIVDDAVTASAIAAQAASGMDSLAARFDESGGGWGALSAGAELFKKATGMQGSMTMLRNEYARIRNSMAIKSLPPGPATDKDIELALKGMPGENASSDVISSFLRGMAKMSRLDADVSSAKAEWVSSFGGLSAAKGPATIAGISVRPGTKFEVLAGQLGRKSAAPVLPTAPPGAPTSKPPTPTRNIIVDW